MASYTTEVVGQDARLEGQKAKFPLACVLKFHDRGHQLAWPSRSWRPSRHKLVQLLAAMAARNAALNDSTGALGDGPW